MGQYEIKKRETVFLKNLKKIRRKYAFLKKQHMQKTQ